MKKTKEPDLFSYKPPAQYPDAPGFKEKGDTSQEAAEAMEPRVGTLRARVLKLLRSGDYEMTADEIADYLRETMFAIRPRVTELGKLGLIAKTGKRRKNASGMNAHVWAAVRPV